MMLIKRKWVEGHYTSDNRSEIVPPMIEDRKEDQLVSGQEAANKPKALVEPNIY